MRHFFSFCSGRMRRRGGAVALAIAAIVLLTGCLRHRCQVDATALAVDPAGNGVFEPGETVAVEPTWFYQNVRLGGSCPLSIPCLASVNLGTLAASDFLGPAEAVYTIVDDNADYGAIPLAAHRSCNSTGDCYQLSIVAPTGRPAAHWDTTFVENRVASGGLDWFRPMSDSPLDPTACPITYHAPKTWTLHVGDSFTDVLHDGYYPFIETILHNGVTGGCGGGMFCPGALTTRAQMAVFLLTAKHGPGYVPPACTGIFTDVECTPTPAFAVNWIEQLYLEGVTGGCGLGPQYCPDSHVTRAEMAVFLLAAAGIAPPACTGIFTDVECRTPTPAFAVNWIEHLYTLGITGGCGHGKYCPNDPTPRNQMAVFLTTTFGLPLY